MFDFSFFKTFSSYYFFCFLCFCLLSISGEAPPPETQKSPVTGSGPSWPVNKTLLFLKKKFTFPFLYI
ncbi:hypothetical protein ERO13_A01G153450v2 [Gossypium hirsutum]|uniref:Uncharacterized protein n=1 Tax=Gossypium darwinii TaxID=34276 RepID=A0A5D2HPU9_GOSDA|nr:hypothetical protein ERO13_A01G153450v2 [Gossypium hirsutum]TYH31476.1 hypothetical protein ES288_A01G176400v1 [Gossypium darwinii]